METNNHTTIVESVAEKIKEGKIKMKSKSYFIVRAFFFATLAVLVLLFSIYIFSFIIFYARISGMWFLPQFGFTEFRDLFLALPWILILFSVAMVLLLEYFAEKIEFIYKHPALYSLLAIIVITGGVSFWLGFTPFHTTVLEAVNEGKLPFMAPLYQGYTAKKFMNFHHGIVSKINNDGFDIITPNGEDISVFTDGPRQDDIQEGNPIVIIGQRGGQKIHALKIKKTKENIDFFPMKERMQKIKDRLKEK